MKKFTNGEVESLITACLSFSSGGAELELLVTEMVPSDAKDSLAKLLDKFKDFCHGLDEAIAAYLPEPNREPKP